MTEEVTGEHGARAECRALARRCFDLALECLDFDRDYGACGRCASCIVNRCGHLLMGMGTAEHCSPTPITGDAQ